MGNSTTKRDALVFSEAIPRGKSGYCRLEGIYYRILEHMIGTNIAYSFSDDNHSVFNCAKWLLLGFENNPEVIRGRQEIIKFALDNPDFINEVKYRSIPELKYDKRRLSLNPLNMMERFDDFNHCISAIAMKLNGKKLPKTLENVLQSLNRAKETVEHAKKDYEPDFVLSFDFCGKYKKEKALTLTITNLSCELANKKDGHKERQDFSDISGDEWRPHRLSESVHFSELANAVYSLVRGAAWLSSEKESVPDKGSLEGKIAYYASNTNKRRYEGEIIFSGKSSKKIRISSDETSELSKNDILLTHHEYVQESHKAAISKGAHVLVEPENYFCIFDEFTAPYRYRYMEELALSFKDDTYAFEALLNNLKALVSLAGMVNEIKKNKFNLVFPDVISAEETRTNTDIYIKNMQNPILAYFSNEKSNKFFKVPERLVPNDVDITTDRNVVIITGPNGNGKTIFGESIFLNYLFFQAGLPVVADEAKIRVKAGGATIYEGQSDIIAGQSRHMADCHKYSEMLKTIKSNMLVFSDEAFTATSIEDATQISRCILEHFLIKANVTLFYTMHNTQLAEELKDNEHVMALCCKLDNSTEPPSKAYRIVPGIDRSYGYLEAKNYGLNPENLSKLFLEKMQEGSIAPRKADIVKQ